MHNLDDDVLHRLCVNEIFIQDHDDVEQEYLAEMSANVDGVSTERTKKSQLSYQGSLCLYRVLFRQKVKEYSQQISIFSCGVLIKGLIIYTRKLYNYFFFRRWI
jgi:hypothetical protein